MRKILTNLMIILFSLCVSSTLGVLVMINGYGVQPVSYAWIVVGGVFGQLFAHSMLQLVGNNK